MNVYNIEKRKQICESCPIYNPVKQVCNPSLWLNPNTEDVSTRAKAGYIKGCGCHVLIKMKNLQSHCIAGKW